MKSKEGSNKWVAEVAEELNKIDEITDLNNKVQNIISNKRTGDFDVATKRYLIECKKSLTPNKLGLNKPIEIDHHLCYIGVRGVING